MKQSRLMLALVFSLFYSIVFAQKTTILDRAHLKCYYSYKYLKDTIDIKQGKEDLLILQIGNKITKFYSQYTFYSDSLNSTPDGKEKNIEEFRKNFDAGNILSKKFTTYVYKNVPDGKITVTDNISTYSFIYQEDLVAQDWEMRDDTTTIIGYRCQKARCQFRGRNYEAWFTPDIPISEGPWKFKGLPGLILMVNDLGNQYIFKIIGIQKVDEPIIFLKSENKSGKYIEIARKQFLKDKMGLGKDWSSMEAIESGISIGISNTGKAKKYDALERDYR